MLSSALSPDLVESADSIVALNVQKLRQTLETTLGMHGKRSPVNAVNPLGLSPLMFAAITGNELLASVLTNFAAHPDICGPSGLSTRFWCDWAEFLSSTADLPGLKIAKPAGARHVRKYLDGLSRDALKTDVDGLSDLISTWKSANEATKYLLQFGDGSDMRVGGSAQNGGTHQQQGLLAEIVLFAVEEHLDAIAHSAPTDGGVLTRISSAPISPSAAASAPRDKRHRMSMTGSTPVVAVPKVNRTKEAAMIIRATSISRLRYMAAFDTYPEANRRMLAALYGETRPWMKKWMKANKMRSDDHRRNSMCKTVDALLEQASECQAALLVRVDRLVRDQYPAIGGEKLVKETHVDKSAIGHEVRFRPSLASLH